MAPARGTDGGMKERSLDGLRYDLRWAALKGCATQILMDAGTVARGIVRRP